MTDTLAFLIGVLTVGMGTIALVGNVGRGIGGVDLLTFWHYVGRPAEVVAVLGAGLLVLYVLARPFLYGNWKS